MACARDIGSEEIIRILKSPEAVRVFRENGVISAYAYGSVAHGGMHAHSDVDVAVVFDRSIPGDTQFRRRLGLITDVVRLLGVNDVDVVPLNDAPPLLVFHVLRDPVVLDRADRRQSAEFEIKMIGMYYDFRPALEEYRRQMFARIEERGLA
jgi:predicted nucleotidyltransferase